MSPAWPLSTKYIVLALILAALIAVIGFAWPLIGSLIVSALLAFVLNPLVEGIAARTRMRRDPAVLVVYLLFLTLLVAIPSILTPLVVRQVLRLSIDLLAIEQQIEVFLNQPLFIGGLSFSPPIQFAQDINQFLRDFIRGLSTGAFDVLGGVTSNLAWLLVVLVATFYFLKDSSRLYNWIVGLVPLDYRHDARRLLREMNRVWSAFLRGQLTLVLLITLLTSIAMAAVGLRGAIGVGILAGVLDIIPSLGPLVGGAIAVLVALIFGSAYLPVSNYVFAALVGVIFLVIQQIENIWLRPQIMGQALRLHPGLVFVGVVGALVLTGVLGALVIIPLMASIGILGRYINAKLLDEPPWPEEALPPEEAPQEESGE